MDLDGIVLLDKKPGLTSFEAVKIIKRLLGLKKAGHAGTLDKFATGLLIICLNGATVLQNIFMEGEKVYRAVVKFGKQTDTLDPYGRIIKESSVKRFTKTEIMKALNIFIGDIEQYPPLYSAIRINGKRLYKRVLSGEEVDVSPRKVHIYWIKLIGIYEDYIIIETKVSKGTYIRSLARDIAEELGTVGYCESLRRLSVGNFNVNQAAEIDNISLENVIPTEKSLSFLPYIQIDEHTARKVSNGLRADKVFKDRLPKVRSKYIRILYEDKLIAILENSKKLKYFKVLGLKLSDNN